MRALLVDLFLAGLSVYAAWLWTSEVTTARLRHKFSMSWDSAGTSATNRSAMTWWPAFDGCPFAGFAA